VANRRRLAGAVGGTDAHFRTVGRGMTASPPGAGNGTDGGRLPSSARAALPLGRDRLRHGSTAAGSTPPSRVRSPAERPRMTLPVKPDSPGSRQGGGRR
jgi:hypothetical protein